MTTRRKTRKDAPKPFRKPPGKNKPLPADPVKGGRPPAIQDVENAIAVIWGLGEINCTKAEVAAVLNVDIDTLDAFFERYPAALEAYENGKAFGKASLRRNQAKLSATNATMAIFLGMNYLGQKDMRNLSGKIDHEITPMDLLLDDIDARQRQREAKMIDVTPSKDRQDAA